MGCQGYHVCLLDPLAGTKYPTSFLCPNGTLFQQQIFNCDWWYNVDCAASEGLYGLAEGAFGSGGDGGGGGDGGAGECPAAAPFSDAECAGAVSNCWSPGQPDTDCPNFGLCCFDGCANTCVDGAPEVIADTQPQAEYVPAETTARPTPAPIIPDYDYNEQPIVPEVTEEPVGYNYPVPDVTLPIRPVTTTQAPIIETPATLYGAPPESVPNFRQGRQGRQQGGRGRGGRRGGRRVGRRRGGRRRQGRRVQNGGRVRAARRINRDQLQETYVFVK